MTEAEYLKRVETLRPFKFKTGDPRAREAGRLGGLASGKKRRELAAIRRRVALLLDVRRELKENEASACRRLIEAALDIARQELE